MAGNTKRKENEKKDSAVVPIIAIMVVFGMAAVVLAMTRRPPEGSVSIGEFEINGLGG
jgi:hypothetical protein